MKIPRASIAQTIATHTLKNGVSKQYAREVASLLLTERRTSELDSLLRDVQADWAENGHVEAIATSAHPLSSEIRREITKQVKQVYPAAKKIIITEVHDPEIIGGVRTSLPNQQLDFSVETKLNTLKGLLV
jgi:F0F1-type ATP synthase delta subunit